MEDEERKKEIREIKKALAEIQAAVSKQVLHTPLLKQQLANLEQTLQKIEGIEGGGKGLAGGE